MDSAQCTLLQRLPFTGQKLFGPDLDDMVHKAADEKKILTPFILSVGKTSFMFMKPFQQSQGVPEKRFTPFRGRARGRGGARSATSSDLTSLMPRTSLKSDCPPVGARLTLFYPHWQEVVSDQWVLRIIRTGCRYPFSSPPPLPHFVGTP